MGRAGRSAAAQGVSARRAGLRRVGAASLALGAGGAGAATLDGHAGLPAAAVAAVVAVLTGRVGLALLRRGDPDRWVRGAAGEVATAALLEALPRRAWVVLHDRSVPGSGANIDHLAIGPSGVWVVDSKAYRAPLRAGWRSVHAGDHRIDTGPAAWEAAVVSDVLGGHPVRAIVAVHGTGLPRRGRRVAGVRVVPVESLVGRLRRRRRSDRLRRSDVRRLAAGLDASLPARTGVVGPLRGPAGRAGGRAPR